MDPGEKRDIVQTFSDHLNAEKDALSTDLFSEAWDNCALRKFGDELIAFACDLSSIKKAEDHLQSFTLEWMTRNTLKPKKLTDIVDENPAHKIALLIAKQRERLKAALRDKWITKKPAEADTKTPVPMDKKIAITQLLGNIEISDKYRDSTMAQVLARISEETTILDAMAEIFNSPEINIDLNSETDLDTLIDAIIAFFYGGKKGLLDTLYPEYSDFSDPNRPPVTEETLRRATPEDPAIKDQLTTRIIQTKVRTKSLRTIADGDMDALGEYLGLDLDEIKRQAEKYGKSDRMMVKAGIVISLGASIGMTFTMALKRNPTSLVFTGLTGILFIIILYKIFFHSETTKESIQEEWEKKLTPDTFDDYLFFMNVARNLYAKIQKAEVEGRGQEQNIEIAREQVLVCVRKAQEIMGIEQKPPRLEEFYQFLPRGQVFTDPEETGEEDAKTPAAETENNAEAEAEAAAELEAVSDAKPSRSKS